MSGRYVSGETKVRPGIYFRETSDNGTELTGAENGVVAVAFKANWGPLGEVVTLENPAQINDIFGDYSASPEANVHILTYIFNGGASQIKAVRVGSGGTCASITLKDTATTAVDVVTLTSKYAGTRALSVTIKDSLSVTTKRECIIYSGTKELLKVTFAKGTDEVNALVKAVNDANSFLTATKVAAGNGTLAALTQTAFTTAGVSPTIANTDYSDAFALLEAESWNVMCVDSNDSTLHALVAAFIDRANDAGLMGIAVIGEPTTVTLANRMAAASGYNSENLVYVANGFKIGTTIYQGFNAAALVAGLLAFLPANDSPTHKTIPGAKSVFGALTNTEIVQCLEAGCLVFTVSATGAVWIEQGINTLNVLSADQDAGWKKIRRTKTRFELITRINASSEGIIGSVGNDANGRDTFIAIANGVINQMIAEGKLVSGTVEEDPSHPASGDSAWFIIDVIDLDSIEKVYLTYRFHFAED